MKFKPKRSIGKSILRFMKSFMQYCGVDYYPISKDEPRKSIRKEMACSEWKIN